ncbi:hypothetical protein OQA88_5327 [Cercophora sp. LCS_1]
MALPTDLLHRLWPSLPIQELLEQKQDLQKVSSRLDDLKKVLEAKWNTLYPMTLEDILCIVEQLQQLRQSSRRDMLQTTRGRLSHSTLPEAVLSKAVDRAASLWLSLDIRHASEVHSDKGVVDWHDDSTLSEAVLRYFRGPLHAANDHGNANMAVSGQLTMAAIIKSHGFRITWTSNLAEHLTIDLVGKRITVFEHKIILLTLLRFQTDTVVPPCILEEALDTLNLLFPFGDTATEFLLRRHKRPFYGLGDCGRLRVSDITRFSHWRSQIEELQHVLDEPPAGFRQLMPNTKNILALSNFGVASIVGLLTVVGLALATVAVVYTVKQYNVSVLQYTLSQAEACAAPDAKLQLPGFCE